MGRYRSYAPKFNRGNVLYSSRSLAVNQAIELKTFDTYAPPSVVPAVVAGSQMGDCLVTPTRVGTQGTAAPVVTLLPSPGTSIVLNAVPQGLASWCRDGRKINMTSLNIAFRAVLFPNAGGGSPANFLKYSNIGRFHFCVVLDTQFNDLLGENSATIAAKVFSSGYVPGDPAITNVNDIVFRHPDFLSRFRVLFHGKHDWRMRVPVGLVADANYIPAVNPYDDQVSIPLKGLPVTFAQNQTLTVNGGGVPTTDLTIGGSITDNGIFVLAWQSGGMFESGFSARLTYSSRLYFTG